MLIANKKSAKILILLLLAANTALFIGTQEVLAQLIPLPIDSYKDSFIVAKGNNALAQSKNLVTRVIDSLRLLIAGAAILLGMIGIIQLVLAQDKEESLTKAKNTMLYAVVGIAIIALSADLAKIFDLAGGGLLGSKAQLGDRLQIFDNTVRIVITFIKYLLGATGILMLVISGLQLVSQGDQEEEVGKAKKNIGYILLGLFGLIFVDNIVRNVFYSIDAPGSDVSIDLGQGLREMVGFTNFIISWTGPIAVITLVAGGLMYVASFGNEELQGTAKKMMITSLVGIVFIYGAFAIVSTIISGSL